MRHLKFVLIAAMVIGSFGSDHCSAITINLSYRAPGDQLGTFGDATAAPGGNTGAGNIQSVVQAAAAYWESAFADDFELNVEYGWFPRDSSVASHRFVSGGGNPYRQTAATIAFDSDGTTDWFLDSTPFAAEEFGSFTEIARNFGGGVMTTGLVFNQATGDALERDLLSTAMHEIGHALGLSSGNLSFSAERGDDDVDVTSPRPFAGAEIPLLGSSAHIDLSNALMNSERDSGVRRLASEADILANAQISRFEEVNLRPLFPGQSRIDYNYDGLVDAIDLDELLAEGPIASGVAADPRNAEFDLNGDGAIDHSDRDIWLTEAATYNGLGSPYLIGDANLDGSVDASDFNIWNGSKFTTSLAWSNGDFNADGAVDGSDFNAWNQNKFTSSDVASVPEPSTSAISLAFFTCVFAIRRRYEAATVRYS